MFTCLYVWLSAGILFCMYAYLDLRLHTYMPIYMNVCLNVCLSTWLPTWMLVYLHLRFLHVSLPIFILHICTPTWTPTYTHARKRVRLFLFLFGRFDRTGKWFCGIRPGRSGPPADTPACGFDGSLCIPDNAPILPILLGGQYNSL